MNAVVEREPFPVDGFNRDCFCIGADLTGLQAWLQHDLAQRGLGRPLVETHPHLFSALPVFVSREHVVRMRGIIEAVESVVALPAYQTAVLEYVPPIARFDPGPRGVFFGYDFHVGGGGPRLIEINSNAGGALLNVELGRAQRACCEEVRGLVTGPVDVASLEDRLYAMFLEEWRRMRGDAPPALVAIVDQSPAEQYLYPEFLLFERLFEARGVRAVVADPTRLDWRNGMLAYDGERLDLVYNRLTDFYFERPGHAALREAYLSGATVVTPHPRAHALYANKRNLALLTDEARLRSWDVSRETIATLLSGIPPTRRSIRPMPSTCGASARPSSSTGLRLRQSWLVSWRQAHPQGVRGDPRRRLRGAGAGAAERAHDARCADPARIEDRSAQLRLRRRSATGRGAALSGPDHQLPHARRRRSRRCSIRRRSRRQAARPCDVDAVTVHSQMLSSRCWWWARATVSSPAPDARRGPRTRSSLPWKCGAARAAHTAPRPVPTWTSCASAGRTCASSCTTSTATRGARERFLALASRTGCSVPGAVVPGRRGVPRRLGRSRDHRLELEALLEGSRAPPAEPQRVRTRMFGEIDARALGLPLFTAAIGLLDGFNPCACGCWCSCSRCW